MVDNSMLVLKLLSLPALSRCEYGEFDNHLLSGKLIVVTAGTCNTECQKVLEKISKITSDYYITNTNTDLNAKNYLRKIDYPGPFPVYFYKSTFLSDINHDEELKSLLKDL